MTGLPGALAIDNQFSAASIDLDTFDFPKVKVVAWSDLFTSRDGRIGDFTVTPENDVNGPQLARVVVTRGSNQTAIRGALQSLADEWNEDPRGSWTRELVRCHEYLVTYYRKQAAEAASGLEKSTAALDALASAVTP